VTVTVLNNGDYAIISEEAERTYEYEELAYAWPNAPIDFVSLAESMGVTGFEADSLERVQEAVPEAIEAAEPTLVEIRTDPQEPQASAWMSE
jgi:acetolactate synthase-1/2/3 large subunit